MIRMVVSATLPTIDALTAGVSCPPSFSYSAARDTSHSFSESTSVPSISHSTAFTPAIVSWARRSVKIMTILVTGATANIGRRIVDHLIDLGANDIRALTTNPAKAKLPDGVTPVIGYLGKPESLPAALAGVDRMYLAPLPDTLDVTLDLVRDGGRLLRRRAVRRCALAAAGRRDLGVRRAHTQLGPGEFLENFAIWSEQIKATRTVREPYPSARGGADRHGRHRQGGGGAVGEARRMHHGQMYPSSPVRSR